MGKVGVSPIVKPFCGLLITQPEIQQKLLSDLEGYFGPLEAITQPVEWTFSRYYEREMGKPLYRAFLIFAQPQPAEYLAVWKLATNQIESKCATDDGKRRVNIDPGYIGILNVVLASTKNAAHRIYLGQGIFAEVTLIYHAQGYQPLQTTYPDYAQANVREMFLHARRSLLAAYRQSGLIAPR